jgi:hypothetical protein
MASPIGTYALVAFADWISGDPMKPYTWLEYLAIAAIYTLMVFVGYLAPKAGPQILSPQNTRKRSTVVGVHCAFLAVFLGTIWSACRNLALMPAWLTARGLISPTRHGIHKVSLLELLFMALLVVLWMIEMPCIYAESKTPHAGTFENPSAPRWMNPPGD